MNMTITRSEKEKLMHRLEVLFNAMPNGLVILDEKGRVDACNPVAQELLGQNIIGKLWFEIIQDVFSPRMDDGFEISLRDGRRISVATKALTPEPGQLLVLTDLTETRLLQESLSRQQRLSELGKMMAELAHQIRTPLSAAVIYTAHLKKTDLSSEKKQHFINKLSKQLQQIEQQIKDMLQFVKGDSGHFEIVSLSQFIADLQQNIETRLIQSQADWNCDNQAGDVRIVCQRDALLGALQNIINNALEATPHKPKLILTACCVDPNRLDLIITDNGSGMSEEVKAQVLKPFFTTRSNGTGLGLAIAQAVAKAHQGELWIESELDQGTRVGIRLPTFHSGSAL